MRKDALSALGLSRREFGFGVGATGLAGLLAGCATSKGAAGAAAAPARVLPDGMKVGYAAITWGDGGDRQAIYDVWKTGYPGIQLRRTISKMWETPEELKADLAEAQLTFACFSGGGPSADPTKRDSEVERFTNEVKFARAAGALYVQATSPNRNERPKIETAELEAFADTLTAIGKRTADMGIPLVFHNHMNQIGENPAEVEIIMNRADPNAVKMLLDTGHWAAAGGDPVAAVKQYGKRIEVLHIKDVVDKTPDEKDKKKYLFVELGKGKVDFKSVFAALEQQAFKSWAVVELDSVPKERAAKDAAIANKAYLESIGLKV